MSYGGRISPPAELLAKRPVAKASRNYDRLASKLRGTDAEIEKLGRELRKAERQDEELRARAELADKPQPQTEKAQKVRGAITDAEASRAATKRALDYARDELHTEIGKHRAETLPALHERRERGRERFLKVLDELERAADEFDAAYGDEIMLEHFPSPIRPLQWSRFLPQIRRPSGEALELGEVLSALRHRFENVAELSDEDRRTIDASHQWETAAAGLPELSLGDERRPSIATNGIRV